MIQLQLPAQQYRPTDRPMTRIRKLMLINEQIARIRIHERLAEAESERAGRRAVAIRRAQRSAERAQRRAERAQRRAEQTIGRLRRLRAL